MFRSEGCGLGRFSAEVWLGVTIGASTATNAFFFFFLGGVLILIIAYWAPKAYSN